MKSRQEENKRIKHELNKMIDESNQICRILDKDDVDIEYINKIGKKIYLKSPNTRKKNFLPNLIYHQGQIIENTIPLKNNSKNNNFKHIFSQNNTTNDFYKNKNKNLNFMKRLNSHFFKKLKGHNNEKIINELIISKNFGKNQKNRKNMEKEEKKVEQKLNLIVPDIMKRKKILTERIPLCIKKYRKNFEYINNQLILDEMNEKRYIKYDDPFVYSLNRYPEKDKLPEYNNLFFKYQKSKIRDYFYRNTYTNFHQNNKDKDNKLSFQDLKFDKHRYTSNGSNNIVKNNNS